MVSRKHHGSSYCSPHRMNTSEFRSDLCHSVIRFTIHYVYSFGAHVIFSSFLFIFKIIITESTETDIGWSTYNNISYLILRASSSIDNNNMVCISCTKHIIIIMNNVSIPTIIHSNIKTVI